MQSYKVRQHYKHYSTVRYKIFSFPFVTIVSEPVERLRMDVIINIRTYFV